MEFGMGFGNREACQYVAQYLGVGIGVWVWYSHVTDLTDHIHWGLKHSLILT